MTPLTTHSTANTRSHALSLLVQPTYHTHSQIFPVSLSLSCEATATSLASQTRSRGYGGRERSGTPIQFVSYRVCTTLKARRPPSLSPPSSTFVRAFKAFRGMWVSVDRDTYWTWLGKDLIHSFLSETADEKYSLSLSCAVEDYSASSFSLSSPDLASYVKSSTTLYSSSDQTLSMRKEGSRVPSAENVCFTPFSLAVAVTRCAATRFMSPDMELVTSQPEFSDLDGKCHFLFAKHALDLMCVQNNLSSTDLTRIKEINSNLL